METKPGWAAVSCIAEGEVEEEGRWRPGSRLTEMRYWEEDGASERE